MTPSTDGGASFIVDGAGVTLIGASTEDSPGAFFMPGYIFAVPLTICHPMNVPSLEYAYIIGGGGTSTFSPDGERWSYLFVVVRSRSKPKRMVSFMSLSNGRLGVYASSTLRLYHASPDASTKHPMEPISWDVLSPMMMRHLTGSQFRKTRTNAPGFRRPGKGKYGGDKEISVAVLDLESKFTRQCD